MTAGSTLTNLEPRTVGGAPIGESRHTNRVSGLRYRLCCSEFKGLGRKAYRVQDLILSVPLYISKLQILNPLKPHPKP